jgi:hypothetical protein
MECLSVELSTVVSEALYANWHLCVPSTHPCVQLYIRVDSRQRTVERSEMKCVIGVFNTFVHCFLLWPNLDSNSGYCTKRGLTDNIKLPCIVWIMCCD